MIYRSAHANGGRPSDIVVLRHNHQRKYDLVAWVQKIITFLLGIAVLALIVVLAVIFAYIIVFTVL